MEILKIENIFADLPELETPRLLLRKLKLEDAEDMFEYVSDPGVPKDSTWPLHKSIEDSRACINFSLQHYAKKELGEWGVALKETGKLIGTCGFVWWKPEHAKAEIRGALSRKYWSRGLMTEAVAALMDFGFNEMKLHRLEGLCTPTNFASEKVMLKNGMKFEGILRDVVYDKSGFISLKLYSMLSTDRAG